MVALGVLLLLLNRGLRLVLRVLLLDLLLLLHLLDDAHGAGLTLLLLRSGVDEVFDLDLGHDWRWPLPWLLGSFGFGDDDAGASILL
jgi:hypothetical protein